MSAFRVVGTSADCWERLSQDDRSNFKLLIKLLVYLRRSSEVVIHGDQRTAGGVDDSWDGQQWWCWHTSERPLQLIIELCHSHLHLAGRFENVHSSQMLWNERCRRDDGSKHYRCTGRALNASGIH